jgi:hypothetical protein
LVVRRRYKAPRGYKLGGAVIPDDAPIAEAPAVATADEPALPPEPAPIAHQVHEGLDDRDAVARAVAAQRRAEELQREAHRQQMNEANQAALNAERLDREAQQLAAPKPPAMSERRRKFIEEHAELRDPANIEAAGDYWRMARRLGIPDDTHEIDSYVLNGLRFEQQARAARSAPHEPDEPEPPVAPPVPRQEPVQSAPMPAPKRSLPMTAPVSREVPNVTGSRRSTEMTLSAEERAVARASIIDRPDMPPLSDAQKEFLYLQNRERMRELKRQGVISDQGRG